MIENWIVDEPIKDENDINKPFVLTERQEISFLKKLSIVFKTIFNDKKTFIFYKKYL